MARAYLSPAPRSFVWERAHVMTSGVLRMFLRASVLFRWETCSRCWFPGSARGCPGWARRVGE
eukprot:7552872-Lingulodinium_polyedra.AAC.1